MPPATIHAALIALDEKGLLLMGPSGAGKSDLALRLINRPPMPPLLNAPPELVADDRVVLERRGEQLIGTAPEPLKGLLEVRGIGIISLPFKSEVEISLAIELGAPEKRQRLPETPLETVTLEGVALPLLHLGPFEASAPEKLLLAMRHLL